MSIKKPVIIFESYYNSVVDAARTLKMAKSTIRELCSNKEREDCYYTDIRIPEGKLCYQCNTFKILENFYPSKVGKFGRASECKTCGKKRIEKKLKNSQWKNHRKNYMLKWHHGISLNEYNIKFNKQNGRCNICNLHQSELNKPLVVDHDHKTGKIRGLLCNQCNFGLGIFKDNVELLKSSINYLQKYK